MTQTLSTAQQTVLLHIARGATITTAAAQAGVHRSTVHLWMRTPAFAEALDQARQDFTGGIRDQFQELEIIALLSLRQLLENTDTPPGIRLKAALAILGHGKSAQPLRSCLDLLQSVQTLEGATAPARQTSPGAPEFDTIPHSCGNMEPPPPGTNEATSPDPAEFDPIRNVPGPAGLKGNSTECDTLCPKPAISRSAQGFQGNTS
jgi:hypothetical protein